MSKTKHESPQAPFFDFMSAAMGDQARADRMIAQDRGWLTLRNATGETALHWLVIENHLDAVRFLIARGMDVNAPANFGDTPLLSASGLGYTDLVALLLEHGAATEATGLYGETPLFSAARHGYVEICDLLLTAGANPAFTDDNGATPLEAAMPRKWEALKAVFEKHGYPG